MTGLAGVRVGDRIAVEFTNGDRLTAAVTAIEPDGIRCVAFDSLACLGFGIELAKIEVES